MHDQSAPSQPPVDWEQVRPVLNEVVRELGTVDRDALLLRFYQQLPFREIGETLRLTEGAVQKRIERALEKLRAGLTRRGITSTSVALAVMLENNAVGAAPAGLAAAVASAAVTAVPLAAPSAWVAVLGLMNTSKMIVVGCGVVALVGGGIYLAGQRDVAPAPASNGTDRVTAATPADRTVARSASPATGASAAVVPSGAESSKSSETSASSASARVTGELPKSKLLSQWLELANAPDFLEARTKQGYKLAQDAYAEFIQRSALSPQDADHLAVLLTEKRLAPTNLAIAQLRNGIEPDVDSAAFREAIVSERAKTDQEIQAFLGPDRFRAFLDYSRQREEEAVLTRLERTIGSTPDALSADQTARLLQELRRSSDGRLSSQIIASLQPTLTLPQQQALQGAFETQAEIQRQRNRDALPPRPSSP